MAGHVKGEVIVRQRKTGWDETVSPETRSRREWQPRHSTKRLPGHGRGPPAQPAGNSDPGGVIEAHTTTERALLLQRDRL